MNKIEARIETCKRNIQYLVEEIDDSYFEEENIVAIKELWTEQKHINKLEIKDETENKKIVVLLKFDSSKSDQLLEELKNYIRQIAPVEATKFQLIGIVENTNDKIGFQLFVKKNKKEICREAKKAQYNFSDGVIFIPIIDKKPIELKVMRMNSLIFPEPNVNMNVMPPSVRNEKKEVSGYMFVVSLNDLVEIYNRVGDELFSSNLRYGIDDEMSLEKAIRSTLLDEPKMFWFYNNGITIVTEKETLDLGTAGKVVLSSQWDKEELDFSVINGAQTISTVARILADSEIDDKKKEIARAKAKVLVRIITARDKTVRKNVTISLNRQKPIKSEDIAFQTPFISAFNEFMQTRKEKGDDYFFITKRGELKEEENTIDIHVFVQLVYTCLMNPSDARNIGPSKLYSEEDGNATNKYFLNGFCEANSYSTRLTYFEKYYKGILWANKVYKEYNKKIKTFDNKQDRIILLNNRWSFVAYVLKHICAFTGQALEIDYTQFEENEEVLENICEYMQEFIAIVNRSYSNNYSAVDSKSSAFWNKILLDNNSQRFMALNTKNGDINKNEEISKEEFINYLIDSSIKYDDVREGYVAEVIGVMFSDVLIVVRDATFTISTTLYYYNDPQESDDKNDADYESLFAEVSHIFEKNIKIQPKREKYPEGVDKSDDLEYENLPFDKKIVNQFIYSICEAEDSLSG